MTNLEGSGSERYALICENLAEVLNPEIIEKILAEGRNPKIYWGEQLEKKEDSLFCDSANNPNFSVFSLQALLQQAALTVATLSPR